MNRCKLFPFLALAILCAPLNVSAANRYVLTNLGTFSTTDESSQAVAINSYGQVVVTGRPWESGALLWTPTRPNGTTGALLNIGGRSTNVYEATAINDYGQVVANGEGGGLLWTPDAANGTTGSWVWLTTDLDTARIDEANGINSSGQVAGTSTRGSAIRMVLWSPTVLNGRSGSTVDLGDLPGPPDSSGGLGINDYGQVTGGGLVSLTSSLTDAALWTPTTPNGSTGSMNVIYGPPSYGVAINVMGQVVGTRFPAFGGGFLWTPSTPNGSTGSAVELAWTSPAPWTFPYSINSFGTVVGAAVTPQGRAFLWTPDVANGNTGTMVDLNTIIAPTDDVHWHLSEARGINDSGQIVGSGGFDPDGAGPLPSVTRAFLLTPVPEPSTLTWALAGAIAILSCRSRFQRAR
jgi:hypothetical protein